MKGESAATVLVIAGVDPSGGAGIFADFRAIESAGVRALGAVTALTVQTERSFLSFEPTPPQMLRNTVKAMAESFRIDAVKTGMLAAGPVAETVAEVLGEIEYDHLVVDPVVLAAVGARLVDKQAEEVLRKRIVPMATLITPNMAEAATLTGLEVKDVEGMREAAKALLQQGCGAAVVTGGHLEGDAVDVLATSSGFTEFRSPKLPGSVHGTGCAYASAAAAGLAKGLHVTAALTAAKTYVESLFRKEIWRAD